MTTEPKTDAELRKLAADIFNNMVFTSAHIPEGEDIQMVFMPLALMDAEGLAQFKDVGLVYEYLNRAGPRAVNGMPSFMSFQALTKEDTGKLFRFYEEYSNLHKNWVEQ